jgi:alpha-tubulin suppressor-like RCC1 family protein
VELPAQIDFEVPIKKIAGGLSHCVAVTANGELYTWGDYYYGLLSLPFWNYALYIIADCTHSPLTFFS